MGHTTKVCLAHWWLSHKPRTFKLDPGDGSSPTVGPSSPSRSHSHPYPEHAGHDHSHSHGSHTHSPTDPASDRRKRRPTEFDMDKVRSTLKQLVRDWSEEVGAAPPISAGSDLILGKGREEREASYQPIKEALLAHFSDIPKEERYVRVGSPALCSSFSQVRFRHNFRVLVPGAGLGRLAYDVANLGERISYPFLRSSHQADRVPQDFPAKATSFRTTCC